MPFLLKFYLFKILFFCLQPPPAAYGSSQGKGRIQAAHATYRAAYSNTTEQGHGSNPHPHRHYFGFLTCSATTGTPLFYFNFLGIYKMTEENKFDKVK